MIDEQQTEETVSANTSGIASPGQSTVYGMLRSLTMVGTAVTLLAALVVSMAGFPAWAAGQASGADWEVEGSAAGEQFGYVVESLGDYDGDGYVDVVVSAPAYAISPTFAPGAVFLYLGSSTGISTTPAYTLTGPSAEQQSMLFGQAMDTVRRVHLENRGHLLVGAPGTNQAFWYAPASVFDTTAGITPTLYFTATGEEANSGFGDAVAVVEDLDGSGYGDFAVGARLDDSDRGKVYVYTGSELTATLVHTLTGEAQGDRFGQAVAGGGDLRGDGYGSLIASAPGAEVDEMTVGKVYVYHGSEEGLSTTSERVLIGPNPDGVFGSSLAVVGDVNGDGYDDLLVGAELDSATGMAYLHLGSPTGIMTVPVAALPGEAADDRFGFSVAPAGDVNNDGFADVIISARDHDGNTGRAYVFAGCLGGFLPEPILTFDGEDTLFPSRYGRWVSAIGQAENDPANGVLVGASGYPRVLESLPPELGVGKVYGYYAPSDLPVCAATVTLSTTVSLAEATTPVCGTETALEVDAGETLAICHTVRNTGSVTLTRHTVSDTIGFELEALTVTLGPGESYTQVVTATATVTDSGTITHTWRGATPIPTPNDTGDALVDSERELAGTANSTVVLAVNPPEEEEEDDPEEEEEEEEPEEDGRIYMPHAPRS